MKSIRSLIGGSALSGVLLFPIVTATSAWTAPKLFEPGLVSTGFDDAHVAFTPDGKTLYFIRNTPDFMHWTVLTAHRKGLGWGPVRIAPFSGRWNDADVFITYDGTRLFFVSTRPVDDKPKDDTDIWVMRREGDHWGAPRHVSELSSPGYEWFPTLTNSGVIYFGSERKGGLGKSDLWRARWLGDHFSEPENLGPVVNTADQEIEPLIAPDESWLIFSAKGRSPGAGNYDLYITYNCPGGWTSPQQLGGGVNSAAWDFGPRLSPDGRKFYFTSNRANTSGEWNGITNLHDLEKRLQAPRNGLRDVYVVDASALNIEPQCS